MKETKKIDPNETQKFSVGRNRLELAIKIIGPFMPKTDLRRPPKEDNWRSHGKSENRSF